MLQTNDDETEVMLIAPEGVSKSLVLPELVKIGDSFKLIQPLSFDKIS